jgi:streptomycin 6-kinase
VSGEAVSHYLTRWRLDPDGAPIETRSSWLLPVRCGGTPAMLKVLKPGSDERNAATILRYFGGSGAVRLFEADECALLMERADGRRSLVSMVERGEDVEAAEILAQVVRNLHAPHASAVPTGLTPLVEWFSALDDHRHDLPILGACATVARGLLTGEGDIVPLHGDLHHGNVLDGGERGWLAIDPKALLGERTFEVPNLLKNSWVHARIGDDPARMRRLASLYADRLKLDVHRVLAFAFAQAGLAASFQMDDGDDPAYTLRYAEVLDAAIKG